MGPLALLRENRSFRALTAAQAVSEVGDWFQLVALLTLLPTAGGQAHVAGGYLALRLLPNVLFSPVAGVVADRFPRGRVLVVCDVLRAGIMLAYLGAIRADGTANVALIYALTFLQETVTAFFEPARSAVVPQIVEPRGLLSANAIGGATWSAMLAIGAALGGLVTRSFGRETALLLNGASFLASAGLVLLARLPPLPPREARAVKLEGEPAEGSFGEAIDWLRAHPGQLAAMFLKSGWGLVGGVVVLFTAFADRVFTQADARAAAAAMGVLYAARGVGALVGPFVAQRIMGQSIAGLCGAVLGAFPVAALGYLGFALSPGVWLAALGVVVAHMGGSTVWVQSSQILQLTVPNRLLGRVSSLELAGLVTTMMASMLGVAALLDAGVAPRKVALALSGIPLLTALAWAFARRRVVSQLLVPSRP
ncbi:MAG: MFS transporter [Myxococcales bacterium]|nr:MFS transporter [Myxococcales bacterium]